MEKLDKELDDVLVVKDGLDKKLGKIMNMQAAKRPAMHSCNKIVVFWAALIFYDFQNKASNHLNNFGFSHGFIPSE
jgi:hypothetical protein